MDYLILDGGLGDELIYCYSPDPVKVAWLRSIAIIGEMAIYKKIEDLPDAYTGNAL